MGRAALIELPCKLYFPKNITIGNEVRIGRYGFIYPVRKYMNKSFDPKLEIGDGTYIGNSSHIVCANSISIGKEVLIADRVFISDCSHGTADLSRSILKNELQIKGSIEIGDGAWIGENVCIFGNVQIGEGAVIGANSVVRSNVPAYAVVSGNPASLLRYRD